MSTETLDERYLNWLYGQVADVKKRHGREFQCLVHQLHQTIFVAFVPHDENRIADAKDLRYEYLSEHEDEQGAREWTRAPCTMFELLIVLSRLLAFEMDDEVAPWFWHLIEVLDLEQFDDEEYDDHAHEVIEAALMRVIWRTYSADGRGGLFPLRDPVKNQKEVELWYQLNAYLLEQF